MDMMDTNKRAFMKASEQLDLEDARLGLTPDLPGHLVAYNHSWLFASESLQAPCGNDLLDQGYLVRASVLAAQHATESRFLPMGKALWEKISCYRNFRHHMDGRLNALRESRERVKSIPDHYSLSEAFYQGDYEPRGAAGVDIRSKVVKQKGGEARNRDEAKAYFWFDGLPVSVSTEIVKGLHSLGFEIRVWIDKASTEYDPVILMESSTIRAFGMVEPHRSRLGERALSPDGRRMCIDTLTAAWTPPAAALLLLSNDAHLYLSYVKATGGKGEAGCLDNCVALAGDLGKAISVLRYSGMAEEEIHEIVEENVYPAMTELWSREQAYLANQMDAMCRGENAVYYYVTVVERSSRILESIRKAILERTGAKLDLPSELLVLEAGVQEIIGRRQG